MLPWCPCLPGLFCPSPAGNSSLLACFLFNFHFFVEVFVVFVFNSCNVWTENPLENDKASFLPAFVTRLIISFLIVYSFEAPCLNGKKICMLIGAACCPLPGQNKTPWLGKISRYLIKYKLLLRAIPGKGIANAYITHWWATLFLKAAYAVISPAFLLGLWINTAQKYVFFKFGLLHA